ncbi:MAG: polysaccharide deacetylase family protein [Lachnospiraceae bacterium]|nr:polysaccharide deacetylase family protein [Lachnospiraceae bacterium]
MLTYPIQEVYHWKRQWTFTITVCWQIRYIKEWRAYSILIIRCLFRYCVKRRKNYFLEILKQHNVKVTFFMTRGWVESCPDDVITVQNIQHRHWIH